LQNDDRYDVVATTVGEMMESVASQTGLEKAKQTVFFKGKKLTDAEQSLGAVGVSEGDTINIVASRKTGASDSDPTVSMPRTTAGEESDDEDDAPKPVGESNSKLDRSGLNKLMADMGGKEGMQSMLKQMGLDGPMTPEKIESMVGQIKGMLDNPAIRAMFDDPEVLERSRKQILENPYLMNAYEGMGMGGLIRDPKAFRDQMEGMKKMLENPQLLSQAMKGITDTVDEFDQGEL